MSETVNNDSPGSATTSNYCNPELNGLNIPDGELGSAALTRAMLAYAEALAAYEDVQIRAKLGQLSTRSLEYENAAFSLEMRTLLLETRQLIPYDAIYARIQSRANTPQFS